MAHSLIDELRAVCGDEHVVTHPHRLRTYESDGLLQYKVTPRAVVLPGTAEEVQAGVRACHRAQGPGGARGSGAGPRRGAPPGGEGAPLSLSRLRRVRVAG